MGNQTGVNYKSSSTIMFNNIYYFNFTLQLKKNFIPSKCSLSTNFWLSSVIWHAGLEPLMKQSTDLYSTLGNKWAQHLHSATWSLIPVIQNTEKHSSPMVQLNKKFGETRASHFVWGIVPWRTVLLRCLHTALCTWNNWANWFNSSDWEKEDFQSCVTMLNYFIPAISSNIHQVPKTVWQKHGSTM